MKVLKSFVILLTFLVLGACDRKPGDASWPAAEEKWRFFAEEHMERMKAHELGLPLATMSGYKFDMKWTRINSRLLSSYFPEYRFFGDQRFTFALRNDGQIICFYIDFPLKKPFESAPDLKPQVFEDFLKEKDWKVQDTKTAEDVAKMAEIIKNAGKKNASTIESSKKFRVAKTKDGWIIDTPNARAGNSTYLNADYEILVTDTGKIKRINLISPLSFLPEGETFYAPSLNKGD